MYISYILYRKLIQRRKTVAKLIKFPAELINNIQDYANKKHNGNFTKAVIDLCKKSLTPEEVQ